MKNKTFRYPLYGSVYHVYFRVGTYQDGSLAVQLLSADPEEYNEPFCDVTKCVDVELGSYEAAVKTYSENEGMLAFLENNGLGKASARIVESGYVTMPVFRFDSERLRSLDQSGCARYEAEKERKTHGK